MGEYIRQEVWPLIEDQAPLFGAQENELKNYIEPKGYGKIKILKTMWDGTNKGYTSFPLGKAKQFGKDFAKRHKERDDEMEGYPEEMKFSPKDNEGQIYDKKGDKNTFYLTKNFPICEIPSAGMASNARALAKLGNLMANKGKFNGKILMSEQTFENIHSEPKKDTLGRRGVTHNLTKGGFAQFAYFDENIEPTIQSDFQKQANVQFNRGREGYYGWMGLGGSIF